MPTAKGKGAATSHRYRPAAEYDDATLAQKREYWRNKKREQRARLSERRGKPAAREGKKLLHLNASAGTYSGLCSFTALASSLQSNDDSYNSASQSGRTAEDGRALAAAESQDWLETVNDNNILPRAPVSCSVSAKAAGCDAAAVTLPTARGAASRAVTSPTSSGTQLNTSSLVPPVGVARITNGSSTTTAPQPCVSMQGAPDPKTQPKARVALPIERKLGMILASSPLRPLSVSEDKTTSATPQSCAKRAKGAGVAQPALESEEERAAKRREHWRIKKREQRAKLAAQIVKTRERAQGVEMTYQRLTSQKAGLAGRSVLLPSQSLSKGVGRKQCPAKVKAAFTSGRRENGKVQCEPATVAMANTDHIQNSHGNSLTPDITSDPGIKKSADPHRKLSNYVHLYNVTRGIARCKTPRQRLIEAQKFFMNQRNLRCKSLLASSSLAFGTRTMPKIDPNDTPEQIVAKRREYWRMKKREQRAKLSSEVRVRLKEKDSVTRRVKRYQKILEEMRRARAMTHSPVSVLTHASETIGGFIKEDGTLTSNIPLGPAEHNMTDNMSEEELHIASKYNSIRQQQSQPHSKRRGVAPVRMNQPPPPLRLAQVKVAFPLGGKSANKPQRLLSVRPRPQLERTTGPSESQAVAQLTLTRPQTLQNAALDEPGLKQGGCVMKLAVSSSEMSLSALSLDPGLTEEERMAKKREYWRIKKREQRAARAVRLKQGVLQARAGASLQRRRAQKQVAVAAVQLSRSLSGRSGKAAPLGDNGAAMPLASDVKQERESVPAVDLNSQPEQAICEDIDPPISPSPPPEPQPEFDPALNADSQATTLLAVASMKKLLEESLSTVTECKNEQTDITMNATEEQDMKPNLPQLFFDKDDLVPITADLTLQIKSWQTDSDVSADSLNQELRNSPQIGEKSPPFPTSNDVALNPTCEHSSQTPLNFIVNPSAETFGGSLSSSPPTTQRVCPKNEDLQSHRSPEPPELHDDAATYLDRLEPRHEQRREQPSQTEEGRQSNISPSAQTCPGAVTEKVGPTSLQSKREYWKLMKRQQRARLKARHKDRHGDGSSHLSSRNLQGSGLLVNPVNKGASPPAKPVLRPKPPTSSGGAGVPSVQAVNRTPCDADPFRDVHSCESSPVSPQLSQEWTPGNADLDLDLDPDPAPSPPTLQPPDNPLSSINLQPIEPPGQSPNAVLSPIKIPCAQRQSPTRATQSPTNMEPLSNVAPPKPIRGESEEDFLRRKREYWRIKKKEQRARKANRDKGVSARRACNNWRPILPAHDLQTQESGQWVNSPEEPEHQMSASVDTDPGSFTYAGYSTPVGDDSEIIFGDYESSPGEDGPISDVVWRTRYLMDYDPLNQLLVCMVCGELQYSHGLEGVRVHIDESHPHTMTLEPAEKRRILEAWDEQVSQRERFFTSQLQQHSGALADWRPVQDGPQDGPHLSPSDIGDRLQPPDAL
ncbi:uncharacterized protein si:dkey-28a3.2 [Mugil cephalus]|uniref:uncharacterized protein si:dkey-28a3.2 n=1 Tax=Mugil cephalus TaxID=48193 RepID=UPI001FB5AE9E|nr:uncharacterized protein si:dkey-28a3.2 [Mugil cephalus]XP_047466219.1 uncharacterized protein si:dkey-28a3.2 [Mugil cephalus]XP_047466228.1 uncharacterized protein si:dkey-28a3.2 [Mugil cephalus]